MEPVDLRRRATSSLLSAYVGQFITTGASLGTRLVLARLIAPEAWGVFAEATLIITVASTLRDMGLRSHLLREVERPYGTVLSLQMGASLALFFVIVLAAPLFGFFSPEVPAVLRLLAPTLLLTGITTTADTYNERELVIRRTLIPQIVSLVVYAVVGIILAWRGWEVWSLVGGTLASTAAYTWLIWRTIRTRVRFDFRLKGTRKLLDDSKYLFFLNLLGLTMSQVDIAIVGALLTPVETGYYSMVYALIFKPTRMIETAVGRVILPVFAELSNERQRLGALYRDATTLVYSIEVPIYAFSFIAPELVVRLLLGPEWMAVVPIVRGMAFYGIISPFGTFGWEILRVLKQDRFFTAISISSAAILTTFGIFLTKRFGIYGMIAANYCVQILAVPLILTLRRLFRNELYQTFGRLVWVYGLSFSFLGLLKLAASDNYLMWGSVGIGACWTILLLPYRNKMLALLTMSMAKPAIKP